MNGHEKLFGSVTFDGTKRRIDVSVEGETVAVSGPLTDSELRASSVSVYTENYSCYKNTTSTPLAAGANFTGEWVDMLNYNEINVSIYANVDSAMNGLVFEWSPDGILTGDTDIFSYYSSTGGTNYTPNPAFRYFRLKYTNGATPQTTFRLLTIFRRNATGGSFHRIDSSLKDDSDGRLVVCVPKLRTSANLYVSQGATANGNTKVSIEEFESGVSSNNNSQLNVTVFDSAGNEINFGSMESSTTITEYNITLTNADTQYSQLLPNSTMGIELQCRDFYDIRWSFTTGKVATPTAPYNVLKAGYHMSKDQLYLTGKTIYFASSQAGAIVELVVFT